MRINAWGTSVVPEGARPSPSLRANGSGNARPMTGSATKQSIEAAKQVWIASSRSLSSGAHSPTRWLAMTENAGARLSHRPDRGRELFGAVAFGHVDDGDHGGGEFVDVADIGEIALGGTAQRFRRDAIEQDQAEIAVLPPRRRAGVELLPAEMENRIRLLARYFPVRDDMRVLADEREAFVGMRRQFEKQQRQRLRGARRDRDIRTVHLDALGMRDRARFKQPLQLDALPLALAEQRHDIGHGMDAADQELACNIDVGAVAQRSRHDRLDHREDVLDPVIEFVDHGRQPPLEADAHLDLAAEP